MQKTKTKTKQNKTKQNQISNLAACAALSLQKSFAVRASERFGTSSRSAVANLATVRILIILIGIFISLIAVLCLASIASIHDILLMNVHHDHFLEPKLFWLSLKRVDIINYLRVLLQTRGRFYRASASKTAQCIIPLLLLLLLRLIFFGRRIARSPLLLELVADRGAPLQ